MTEVQLTTDIAQFPHGGISHHVLKIRACEQQRFGETTLSMQGLPGEIKFQPEPCSLDPHKGNPEGRK